MPWRLFCFFILAVSAFFLPLPLTLVLFAVLASVFSRFAEGLAAGIFLDAFYPAPVLFSKMKLGFFTLGFVALIFLMEKIKKFVENRNLAPRIVVGFLSGFLFYLLSLLIFN